MAERSISVAEGTVFGTATRPTTVTAENISIEPGVVAHGTVWAHVDGRVVLDTSEKRRAQREGAGRKSA